jgi:hypothetical protein
LRAQTTKAQSNFRKLCGVTVTALLFSFMLFVVAAPPAHADPRDRCRHRIEKAEARLHEAIRHHGIHSREAEARRHELNEERERCWNEFHAWWDGDAHQWHTQRDWDHDNDHDHP